MKKILTLFAMMAMLSVACTPEDQPGNENAGGNVAPALELKSESELEFEAEGGDGKILYVLRNPVAWVSVSADCEADWVTDLVVSDNKTTFKVSLNRKSERRSTKIVVSYGNVKVEVDVVQLPGEGSQDPGNDHEPDWDTVFNASHLYGEYYEDYGNNYYIILSDDPDLTADESYFNLNPGCTYYFLDLYSNVGVSGTTIVLPEGEYIDEDGSVNVESAYSLYMYYGETEDEDVELLATSVSVSVTGNKIEALITLEDGSTHKVVYSGSLALDIPYGDSGYDDGGDDGYDDGYDDDNDDDYNVVSTLTGDLNVVRKDCVMLAEYYGDFYDVGLNNWTLYYETDDEYMMFDVLTSSDEFIGDYTFLTEDTTDDQYDNLVIPAFLDEEGYTYGTWYMSYSGEDYKDIVPLFDGNVTIDYEESTGNCTIQFECYDDAGHKVYGQLSGTCETYDASEDYASYAKKNRRSSCTTFKSERKAPRAGKVARLK